MAALQRGPVSPTRDERRGRLTVMFTDWPFDCWRSPEPMGFDNETGVVCFRNCIFVILMHMPALVHWLYHHLQTPCVETTQTGECVACLLGFIAQKYRAYGKLKNQAELNSLAKETFECCQRKFWDLEVSAQQDAEEFFSKLLNHLISRFEHSQQDDRFLRHMFQTVYKIRKECEKCGIVSYEKEYDYIARISPLEDTASTLYEALERSLTGDVSRICESCRHSGLLTRRTFVRDAPEILVFQINRHGEKEGKLMGQIRYDENIVLTELLEPYAREKGEVLTYELYSAVLHKGEDVSCGHYTAYVRTPEDKWAHVNDDEVQTAALNDVLCTKGSPFGEPYILVYMRKPLQCADNNITKLTVDDSLFNGTLPPMDQSTLRPTRGAEVPPQTETTSAEQDQEAEAAMEASFELPNLEDDPNIEIGNSPPIHTAKVPLATRWEGQPAEITVNVTMGEMVLTGVLKANGFNPVTEAKGGGKAAKAAETSRPPGSSSSSLEGWGIAPASLGCLSTLVPLRPSTSHQNQANNPLSSLPPEVLSKIKPLLLTLHCLFPNEFLLALDILDRKLVRRYSLADDNTAHGTYFVLSASSRTATGSDTSHTQARLYLPEKYYQIHLHSWNCTCPAFALAAFSSLEEFAPEQNSEQVDDPWLPPSLSSALRAGDAVWDWRFGGTLGRKVGSSHGPPMCKHLLACLLASQCSGLFGHGVEQVVVSEAEMAALHAG
ncbi:predicted protein [Uncinocarpus reesii 1704]|uniref:USP domain-containing protein n=1 Tax=Uncinocarpus reesii (strain UAMH 1704) TaxID=336963 RepID=C4JPM7_UNCRE|nr:uncharacterized protein UREG_03199 [Uncinocarpus reesii 1704]EEP78353.1 predicted protein [Uncinocarpus reesii 1704]